MTIEKIRKIPTRDGHQLIKMTMMNEVDTAKILSRKKNLFEGDEKWRSIYISRSMTREERVEKARLRQVWNRNKNETKQLPRQSTRQHQQYPVMNQSPMNQSPMNQSPMNQFSTHQLPIHQLPTFQPLYVNSNQPHAPTQYLPQPQIPFQMQHPQLGLQYASDHLNFQRPYRVPLYL
jgi:hypothetical protein